MPEGGKDQVINQSISNVFFLSVWVNRCYSIGSVACFREIYSFRDIKEELLLCKELQTTSADVLEK